VAAARKRAARPVGDAPSGGGKPPIRRQVSSGGVAFRRAGGGIEIAIVSVGPTARWQLPKGIVDAGESPETTAVRETREEAGIETELVAPLETIQYWYQATDRGERVRFHKFVHFFLLEYRAGDVADHDHEVNEARWVPIEQAITMLAFGNERSVVTQAAALLRA
jgi:8-oxo-dGTP pyrophosphatase MutT (NUDIX family)